MNFEDAIDEEILKTKIKICDLENRIANQNQAARNGSLENLLECQRDLLRQQQSLKERIKNVDDQYPNQYHKQRNEKMQLFMKGAAAQQPCR
jgi:predicted nucleotidyltransferase